MMMVNIDLSRSLHRLILMVDSDLIVQSTHILGIGATSIKTWSTLGQSLEWQIVWWAWAGSQARTNLQILGRPFRDTAKCMVQHPIAWLCWSLLQAGADADWFTTPLFKVTRQCTSWIPMKNGAFLVDGIVYETRTFRINVEQRKHDLHHFLDRGMPSIAPKSDPSLTNKNMWSPTKGQHRLTRCWK